MPKTRSTSKSSELLPLKLYAAASPSGFRVATILEFLGLEYKIQTVNLKAKEQKEQWYLDLNPNGKIPTLVDPNTGFTITQTAAVAQYLVDTYDPDHKVSFKYGSEEYYKQLEYINLSVSEFAAINSQLFFFKRMAGTNDEFAITHLSNEVNRIISVFEQLLSKNTKSGLYFIGDHYSIVDASIYGWSRYLAMNEIDVTQFKLFKQWYDNFDQDETVQRGVTRLLHN
ncbi:glutathione S-transferase [Scheffersomyces coipomensis]|uniref:glutathione S-transferase n=1 Tax=Scheffersomyces coipomensis TaxID=1788519 RepID=UPI00315DB62C